MLLQPRKCLPLWSCSVRENKISKYTLKIRSIEITDIPKNCLVKILINLGLINLTLWSTFCVFLHPRVSVPVSIGTYFPTKEMLSTHIRYFYLIWLGIILIILFFIFYILSKKNINIIKPSPKLYKYYLLMQKFLLLV